MMMNEYGSDSNSGDPPNQTNKTLTYPTDGKSNRQPGPRLHAAVAG